MARKIWRRQLESMRYASSASHPVAGQLALEQGSRLFRAAFAATPDVTALQWATVSGSGVLPQNFVQVSGSPCPEGQTCPDFSATGAPITFGYFRASANEANGAAFEITHGIDNWRVTVHRQ